jgi:hypothetical protein
MDKRSFISAIWIGVCFCIIFLSTQGIYGQENKSIKDDLRIADPNHVQILTTRDGSTLIGRIVEIGASEIQFETELGKVTIPILKIKEIKEVPASSIKNGKYWFPNPNATRLFFGPTGRMLKQGEGYFADYYLFFPAVAYAVTSNITIGGGMSLFPGVDIDKQIFYFTPKLGLKVAKNLDFATGALLIKVPDFFDNEDSPIVGILYGVGTYGTLDRSITAGFGYGFVDKDFAEKPMIMIGGEQRLSRRMSLVSENWIFPGVDEPLVSYGMRFFGEALSVDLAFINILGEDAIFPGVPYIDFVFNF